MSRRMDTVHWKIFCMLTGKLRKLEMISVDLNNVLNLIIADVLLT